jgi:hypothetical protein
MGVERLVTCVAAVAAVIVGSGGAASASTSSTGTGWQVNQVFGAPDYLSPEAITADNATDAWISGYDPIGADGGSDSLLIEHWTGSEWTQIPAPAGYGQNTNDQVIGASSASNMWTFPDVSTKTTQPVLQWDGQSWNKFNLGHMQVLNTVAVGTDSDWAFGYKIPTTPVLGYGKPYAAYYNGSTWTKSPMPGVAMHVSEVSPTDIWAVGPTAETAGDSGTAAQYIAMRWNGTRWKKVSIPQPPTVDGDSWVTTGIAAIGPKNVWVMENPAVTGGCGCAPIGTALLHWDGEQWTTVTNMSYKFQSLARTGSGGLWLSGFDSQSDETIAQYADGNWTYQAPPTESGYTNQGVGPIVRVPGTKQVWGLSGLEPVGDGISESAVLQYAP